MNTLQSILYINPTLKNEIDFIIEDHGKGLVLTWLNTIIPQPTQAELEAAWIEFEKETKKQNEIDEYKYIEQEATNKRAEYLTAELLPDSVLKTKKLAKLEEQRTDIETRFNESLNSLTSEYGEEILDELI